MGMMSSDAMDHKTAVGWALSRLEDALSRFLDPSGVCPWRSKHDPLTGALLRD